MCVVWSLWVWGALLQVAVGNKSPMPWGFQIKNEILTVIMTSQKCPLSLGTDLCFLICSQHWYHIQLLELSSPVCPLNTDACPQAPSLSLSPPLKFPVLNGQGDDQLGAGQFLSPVTCLPRWPTWLLPLSASDTSLLPSISHNNHSCLLYFPSRFQQPFLTISIGSHSDKLRAKAKHTVSRSPGHCESNYRKN